MQMSANMFHIMLADVVSQKNMHMYSSSICNYFLVVNSVLNRIQANSNLQCYAHKFYRLFHIFVSSFNY